MTDYLSLAEVQMFSAMNLYSNAWWEVDLGAAASLGADSSLIQGCSIHRSALRANRGGYRAG
jgi:hypothetical protein